MCVLRTEEGIMRRERALKIMLALVGLLFVAGIYPIAMYLWRPGNEPPGDTMMLTLYVTLGIFLLLAVRNPSEHRLDRLCRMGEHCALHCDGADGNPSCHRPQTSA